MQRPYFPPVGVAAWGLLRSTGIPGGEQERGDLGDELEAVGVRLPLRRHRDSGEGQGELHHDGWVATTRSVFNVLRLLLVLIFFFFFSHLLFCSTWLLCCILWYVLCTTSTK